MASRADARPNILIIVVDCLRADHVSCYGYHRETTPNIDRLAAEGCLFDTAITAAPFSPASYASLFSGLYPHQHGVNGDTVRIWPDTFARLAERMKANGYSTFGVSNNDFVSTKCNATQGFDRYEDVWGAGWYLRQRRRAVRAARKYLGNNIARRLESNAVQCAVKGDSIRTVRLAIEMIQASKDQPFFGLLVLMDPHAPYNRRRQDFLSKSQASSSFFRDVNAGNMWVRSMATGAGLMPEHLQVATECYDSEIRFADQCVGRLCSWMRQRERLDETVIIIASDHGESFGEHGVWGHGFCLNDCLTRVPLVIRCPRYWNGGQRSSALVQLHDIHELCLSISTDGNPRPSEHERCLTQASDPHWPGREMVFSEFSTQSQTLQLMTSVNPAFDPGRWAHHMWAVRTREWRYIEYESGQYELYDLRTDPGETTPVHENHPGVCEEFRTRLHAHRNDHPYSPNMDETSQAVDDVVAERLRSLGYIE